MKFDVTYNLTELRELAKKYPKIVEDETVSTLTRIVTRMESETVERTPAGVGGAAGLRGSVHGGVMRQGKSFRGFWGTPLEYGEVIEEGRRPGKAMPPVHPIALWARSKLGVPTDEAESAGFAIARKIAVYGFEGAHMFEEAWEANEKWVQDQLYGIVDRVVERIERGT